MSRQAVDDPVKPLVRGTAHASTIALRTWVGRRTGGDRGPARNTEPMPIAMKEMAKPCADRATIAPALVAGTIPSGSMNTAHTHNEPTPIPAPASGASRPKTNHRTINACRAPTAIGTVQDGDGARPAGGDVTGDSRRA